MIVQRLNYGNFVEYRLTEDARKILRQIMKEVRYFHENNLIPYCLDQDNIFVSATHEVHIVEPNSQMAHNSNSCAKDCAALRKVIIEMIGGNQTPKDVAHLKILLHQTNPLKDHEAIFNHPCLWSQQETLRNIFIFRMVPRTKSKNLVDHFFNNASRIPKHETTNWTQRIPIGSTYERTYIKWQNDLQGELQKDFGHEKKPRTTPEGFYILTYMRNCVQHAYRELTPLEIENELFVMFPTIMCCFVEHVIGATGIEKGKWEI